MKWLWEAIKRYFEFSKSETNGFLGLMLVMLLFLAAIPQIPVIYQYYSPAPTYQSQNNLLDSLSEIVDNQTALHNAGKTQKKYQKLDTISKKTDINPFYFNPNTISESEMAKLGLPNRVIKNILNYRAKGGQFKTKTDLKRIYGMPIEVFEQLKAYLQLPDTLPALRMFANKNQAHSKGQNQPINSKKLNLNTADSMQFIACYGIGAKRASAILKYRKSLGGFISMNQIEEIWGLDSTAKAQIYTKFEILPDFIPEKIPVNRLGSTAIIQHPYINKNEAKMIKAYIASHKFIPDSTAWLTIQGIDETTKRKILPYLQFDF